MLRESQTRTIFILSLFFLSISINIYGASGDLDPAFGDGGKMITSLESVADHTRRIRLQPDGRILILTSNSAPFTGVSSASIYRFNPDGSYDASFGTSGQITYSGLRDFAVLPDGRLVVAITNYGRATTGYVKRFSSDGQLDLTFGSGGNVEIASNDGTFAARRIQVDPSGKIFVAGATINGYTPSLEPSAAGTAFAKLNYDGSFDNSFGNNGVAYGYGVDSVYTLVGGWTLDSTGDFVIQTDGKIAYGLGGDWSDRSFVARLNSDGSIDYNFGRDGYVTIPIHTEGYPYYTFAFFTKQLPDGDLLVSGTAFDWYGRPSFASVARLNPDGTFDTAFGENGIATISSGSRGPASAAVVLANKKILLGGMKDGTFSLTRLTDKGAIDLTFGVGGTITTPIGEASGITSILDMAMQPDGKVVAVGSTQISGAGRIALTRYLDVSGHTIPVTNVEELYTAVNDTANIGATLVLAPGEYMLSVDEPDGTLRPNGGRLEFQENMSLVGVVGDRGAVVINAINLPINSYQGNGLRLTAAIRLGRGTNSIEWLTVRDTQFGGANIDTNLVFPGTAYVRIAHVASSGGVFGLNALNYGPGSSGETLEIDIIDNDFFLNTFGFAQGLRIGNFARATGSTVNARIIGNRSWGNELGCLIVNSEVIDSTINVFSMGNRFVDNGAGTIIFGGLSGIDPADGNTINFEAHGDDFIDNDEFATFDIGGLVVSGGENILSPNYVNNNTVNVSLWGCRMGGNNTYDLLGIGARSAPESIGTPGVNNRVTIEIHGEDNANGRWQPVEHFENSIPFDANTTNSVTIIR
jgi:uncharacterized delta-60 repeat protein